MLGGDQGLVARTKNFVQSFLSKWSRSDGLGASLESVLHGERGASGAATPLCSAATVREAVQRMLEQQTSAVLVRGTTSATIVGIFTERDVYVLTVTSRRERAGSGAGALPEGRCCAEYRRCARCVSLVLTA